MASCKNITFVSRRLLLISLILSSLFTSAFSSLLHIYQDISNILKEYYIGFEIGFKRDNRFNSFPYRENIHHQDLNNLGFYQYYATKARKDTLIYKYSCRLSPRFSLEYESTNVFPFRELSGGHYYFREETDSTLKIKYQISPKFKIFSNINRVSTTNKFSHTYKGQQNTSEYWNITKNDRTIDTRRVSIGGETIQDWGSIDFSVSDKERYIKYYNFIQDEDVKKTYWLYEENLIYKTNEVGIGCNVNPSEKLTIYGNVGYRQETKKEKDVLLRGQKILYPFYLKYKIEDKWEFSIDLQNEFSTGDTSVFQKELFTTFDKWKVVEEDITYTENKQQISLSRYFKYSGLCLKSGIYRRAIYNVYNYQDEIMTPDEKKYVWKYWDSSNIFYGIVLEFVMRPIMHKLFFHATVDYSPWQRHRTRHVLNQDKQTTRYTFKAFYKPTQMFEIFVKKDFSYSGIESHPTMIPIMNTPDLWKILKDNKIGIKETTTAGCSFRYLWGRFTFEIHRNDTVSIYSHRDSILLEETKSHPWRYGDSNYRHFIYSFSGFVQPVSPLTLSVSFFTYPSFITNNSGGNIATYAIQGYKVYVKYDFSPQFHIQGSLTKQSDYTTTQFIHLSEINSPLANTDALYDTNILEISLKYRI